MHYKLLHEQQQHTLHTTPNQMIYVFILFLWFENEWWMAWAEN